MFGRIYCQNILDKRKGFFYERIISTRLLTKVHVQGENRFSAKISVEVQKNESFF